MQSLYDRRLILFSGKGGVGKTTIASAFALSCALRGQKTLLIELNVKDRLSAMFGAVEVGTEITEIEENLYAVNTTPKAALEEYGMMILRLKLVYKAVFENNTVSSFFRVIPGLNELVMLGKAYFHVNELGDDGKPRWDKVVIDAPATGHGIFFMRIPSVITSIIDSGPMFSEARKIEELLQDPQRTALCLVTLPEEMPVNETLMFRKVVEDELKVPMGAIIANCVYPSIFSQEEMQWITQTGDDPIKNEASRDFIEVARFRTSRVNMQQEYLDLLKREIEDPQAHVPYYFTERFDFTTIRKIAQDLEDQLGDGRQYSPQSTR